MRLPGTVRLPAPVSGVWQTASWALRRRDATAAGLEQENAQLRQAVDSRATVDQAIGVLTAYQIPPTAGFEVLRELAAGGWSSGWRFSPSPTARLRTGRHPRRPAVPSSAACDRSPRPRAGPVRSDAR
ncbi:ANTAR domain-containing protein [Streptomyces sp. NPDC001868]|uniref:ANTAR domain-containing protein n=1 Tax=Streptomyces sp. NPDC001868 TaxID=3154401 RepID=UPI00331E995D